jgi:tetratricopeptide (TPR) repeat protein
MSDPLRTEDSRALDAASAAERNAKIEELLLVGLDHYFAGRYEQAINVWTRALFFDRSHPRARAYIERARSALAERQRQSEELLHDGVAAFQRGESAEARRLLQAAIDAGAPSDEALALLERLNRLDAAAGASLPRPAAEAKPAESRDRTKSSSSFVSVAVVATAVIVAIAGIAFIGAPRQTPLDWKALLLLTDAPSPTAPIARDASLPLPRRGDILLARARTLAAGGHIYDALAALDGIRSTDPARSDADRLRGDLQRQLLTLPAR